MTKWAYDMVRRGLALQGVAERAVRAGERFWSGLALGSLSPEQLAHLTAAIYSTRGRYEQEKLLSWERAWFGADLPPAPARILVGGAGSGREVAYLLAQGYQVVAFDPAQRLVATGRRRLSRAAWYTGKYEDLSCSGTSLAQELARHAPFAGMLLGWGSFTHVAHPDHRLSTLQALHELAPAGPLLLSLWLQRQDPAYGASRAAEAGFRLGRSLGHRPPLFEVGRDVVSARFGYAHFFTPGELADLAATAGYTLSRRGMESPEDFPHFTLTPG